jgi:hypothetical protein
MSGRDDFAGRFLELEDFERVEAARGGGEI